VPDYVTAATPEHPTSSSNLSDRPRASVVIIIDSGTAAVTLTECAVKPAPSLQLSTRTSNAGGGGLALRARPRRAKHDGARLMSRAHKPLQPPPPRANRPPGTFVRSRRVDLIQSD